MRKLISILIFVAIFTGLFIQCSNPSNRITVKGVTVRNGAEIEEIKYLDKRNLEFEILLLGEGESFMVIQQISKMTWKNGEPDVEMVCIIDDSVNDRIKVNGFTKAKEFKNRNEFIEFMTSKEYVLTKEDIGSGIVSFTRY